MPSIFGSEDNSISDLVFKKLLIFFLKSIISFMWNAFPSESIGLECLTFSNLVEGFEPIRLSRFCIFFKKGFLFANSINSCLRISN